MSIRQPRNPLRRRRPAVQAELDLPAPPGTPGEPEPRELEWWQAPWFVALLAGAAALLLLLTIVARVAAYRDRELAATLDAQVRTLTLRPSTQLRTLRIAPNPRSWSAAPDATIRTPDPPELLELYLPVAYSEFKSFALAIDKVDAGRVMLVSRMVPDSNRDLRISLNSSAFGPGEYRMRLQGYTWRGQLVDAGWVRLVVQPPG